MILNVKNIVIGYPKENGVQTILDQASFNVNESELLTILGSSGVGKSSLLRVLAGLARPLSGEVHLFGQLIDKPHPDIGYVFQAPTLLPWLSVQENIAFGLDFACRTPLSKSDIQRRVGDAMEEVGLTQSANAYPQELSGGMAQRVNLARAIARDPKLILLDEPFSALDPVTREQMQQMLHQIVKHHKAAAVMITHDIDEALTVSDKIILLSGKPATITGKWHLQAPFPRNDLLALNHYRVDILQQLQSAKQTSTIEYMI